MTRVASGRPARRYPRRFVLPGTTSCVKIILVLRGENPVVFTLEKFRTARPAGYTFILYRRISVRKNRKCTSAARRTSSVFERKKNKQKLYTKLFQKNIVIFLREKRGFFFLSFFFTRVQKGTPRELCNISSPGAHLFDCPRNRREYRLFIRGDARRSAETIFIGRPSAARTATVKTRRAVAGRVACYRSGTRFGTRNPLLPVDSIADI